MVEENISRNDERFDLFKSVEIELLPVKATDIVGIRFCVSLMSFTSQMCARNDTWQLEKGPTGASYHTGPVLSSYKLIIPSYFPKCNWRQHPIVPPFTCCAAQARRPHDGALSNTWPWKAAGLLCVGELEAERGQFLFLFIAYWPSSGETNRSPTVGGCVCSSCTEQVSCPTRLLLLYCF